MKLLVVVLLVLAGFGILLSLAQKKPKRIETNTGSFTINVSRFDGRRTCLKECARKFCQGTQCELGTGIEECERFCETKRR